MSTNMFQDSKYKDFINNIERDRQQKSFTKASHTLKNSTLNSYDFNEVNHTVVIIIQKFKSQILQFLDRSTGIDFNNMLYNFKKISFFDEISLKFNQKLVEQNNILTIKLIEKQQMIHELQKQLQTKLFRFKTQQSIKINIQQPKTGSRNTKSTTNAEITKILYQKAKILQYEQFNELFNTYQFGGKTKLINLKQNLKTQYQQAQQIKQIIAQSIKQIKKTIQKLDSRMKLQYISNNLKQSFRGKKQKLEIISRLMCNHNILNCLQKIIQNGSTCNNPCCMSKYNQKNQQIFKFYAKSQNSRYQNSKKSSSIFYRSDKIDQFVQKLASDIKDNNTKSNNIRSIQKSNLQLTQNYEKKFLKILEKRKKIEYLDRRKHDKTILQFIKQKKIPNKNNYQIL